MEHWNLVPWALKDWLIRLYVVGQDGIEKDGREWTFSQHPDWPRALKECQLAVEEYIRDSRPTLHG